MARLFYSIILYAITPIFFLRLLIRGRKAPAYLRRWNERLALYPKAPFDKRVIWIHAVSVGEVEAAIPLIKRLRSEFPGNPFLITTTTPTGSSRVKNVFADQIVHVYLPYDLPVCVNRFYRRFNPLLGVIMETEIWPNLFFYGARNGTRLVIANARLSAKSAARYRWFRSLTRSTLDDVSCIAGQNQRDAKRFIDIGAVADKVVVSGNIKFDLVVPTDIEAKAKSLRNTLFGQRPIFIAASTHAGEDEKILEAFVKIKRRFSQILLILVPRHPERFDSVADLCRDNGFTVRRRTEDIPCTPATDVFLLDTMGELKVFYALSDIVFVAGSLVKKGGHNVLEPAALARPVIVGPHTFNFEEITRLLIAAGAAARIGQVDELKEKVIELMEDKNKCNEMGRNGSQFVHENRGAIEKTMSLILAVMETPGSSIHK